MRKLDDKRIIEDYQNGMTWNQLCEKYNTNTGSLFKVFKRNNIVKTRVQDTSWNKEKQELFKTNIDIHNQKRQRSQKEVNTQTKNKQNEIFHT